MKTREWRVEETVVLERAVEVIRSELDACRGNGRAFNMPADPKIAKATHLILEALRLVPIEIENES